MKHIPTLIASLALAATATAGTTASVEPAGKGKACCVTPTPACPNMLSYSYLEAGYIRLDPDAQGVQTQDGGYLDASWEVAPHFLIDGSATIFDDSDQFTVGIGTYIPLCSAFHLTARTGYSYYDADGADSQNEWYISPGFRAMLGCHLELWGKVYINVDSDETEVSYGGGLTYHFCPHTGLTVGAAGSSDGWSLQTGLRYQF